MLIYGTCILKLQKIYVKTAPRPDGIVVWAVTTVKKHLLFAVVREYTSTRCVHAKYLTWRVL